MRTLKIEKAIKLARIECSGSVSNLDVKEAMHDLRDLEPGFSLLLDMTGVEDFAITADAIRQLAVQAKPGVIRQCAVIAPGSVAYGFSRMFGMLCESVEFAVFRAASPAYTWLGIPPTAAASE